MITIKLIDDYELTTDVSSMTGMERVLNDRSNDFFSVIGEVEPEMGEKLTMRHIVNKRHVIQVIGKK